MSWHYLQEEGVDFSLQDYLDGIPCAQSNMTKDTEKVSLKSSDMETLINSQYGMTLEHLTEDLGAEKSKLLPVDFHAQDISAAGKGAGIDGERSGLWSE